MKAISDNLIHFLGRQLKDTPLKQFEIFKSIIENGLKLSNIETVFGSTGMILNKVVCFTDIPLNFCDDHTAVYGKFGIGFKRSYIKSIGGNPVRYFVDHEVTLKPGDEVVETRGLLFSNLKTILNTALTITEHIREGIDGYYDQNGNRLYTKQELESFQGELIQLLSFDKEIGDLGPARDDTNVSDPYYKEREWRIVPYGATEMSRKVILREEGGYYCLFKKNDIRVIIVPNKDIKQLVVKYFDGLKNNSDLKLREYSEDPPSILIYDDLKYF